MRKRPDAYTVGNPRSYEEHVAAGASKGTGGVVFRTRSEAQAILDAHHGNLPADWFDDDLERPGRVYGLSLPAGWSQVEIDGWETGQHKLLAPAPLLAPTDE